MRVLIIDGQSEMDQLNHLLNKHFPQVEVVGMAHSAAAALALVEETAPDLVLLGLDLSKEIGRSLLLRMGKQRFALIFLAVPEEQSTQHTSCSALQCLPKPLEVDQLAIALYKAWDHWLYKEAYQQLIALADSVKKSCKKEERLVLPTANGPQLVLPTNILYCEGNKSYTHFFLVSGQKLVASYGLYRYAQELEELGFVQVNRDILVNISHVTNLSRKDTVQELVLLDGKATVHVARSMVAMVKEKLYGRKKKKRK